jgi:hypothetical protein
MGSGSLNSSTFRTYASSYVGKKTEEVFASRKVDDLLNPHGVKIRESRDSDDNPESNAIILALDVTGSMGMIADNLARQGLGTVCDEFLKRQPVSNPHFMFNAIGDVRHDSAPLQVSQFEADDRMIQQLVKIFIEHGGGGNDSESYDFAWYFAGTHTSIDCWEKRKRKGYLFTIGDESTPHGLTKEHIRQVLGEDIESDLSAKQCLALAEKMYHVYHIIIAEGSYPRSHGLDKVHKAWTDLLGQRAVVLTDYTKLAELIISLIQMNEGVDKSAVVHSWDGSTAVVILNAVKDIALDSSSTVSEEGIVTL